MIEDSELRDIFKTSSEERLQALDEGLLHLEKHPDDLDTVAAIMREAHSLKGDGNMLGVDDLGKVAHQIEHILGAIRRGERSLNADVFDRLAHGMEAMRQIVNEAVTGEPAQIKVFYILAELMAAEMTEEENTPIRNRRRPRRPLAQMIRRPPQEGTATRPTPLCPTTISPSVPFSIAP